MKILIKRTLMISNRQDYFGKIMWINFAACIIAMIFSIKNEFLLRSNAHLLIEICISITTCGIFNIHRRNNSDFVYFISSYSKWKKFCALLISSMIQNSLFLLFFFVQLILVFKAQLGVAVLTAVLHFTYAIAFGALVGAVIRYHTAANLCLVVYYLTLFMGRRWPEMEMYRLCSPVLQLVNLGSVDVSNTAALIGLSLLILTISYSTIPISIGKINGKGAMVFILGLLIILTVGFQEYQYNLKIKNSDYKMMDVNHIMVFYRGVSQQEVETYGEWLSYIETKLIDENVIKEPIRKLEIQRYFISPSWMPYLDAPMVPVQIKEGVMYINIFSKAMMLHSNVESRYDILQRMMWHYMDTTEEGKQAGILGLLYISDIIVNPENSFFDEMRQYNNRINRNFLKMNKER